MLSINYTALDKTKRFLLMKTNLIKELMYSCYQTLWFYCMELNERRSGKIANTLDLYKYCTVFYSLSLHTSSCPFPKLLGLRRS